MVINTLLDFLLVCLKKLNLFYVFIKKEKINHNYQDLKQQLLWLEKEENFATLNINNKWKIKNK